VYLLAIIPLTISLSLGYSAFTKAVFLLKSFSLSFAAEGLLAGQRE
jgi:hypothetical protein